MSRIGKQPVTIPQGTDVKIENGVLTAKGGKGEVSQDIFEGFEVERDGDTLTVQRPDDSGPSRSRHGLLRSLIDNAVQGVSNGFTKELEIIGVGYRVELKGREAHFALGYSHPVVFPAPDGIDLEVDSKANRIKVTGADRQKVGQVAAEIRGLRRPDPYKGKGIKYVGEQIRRKVGKAGAK
jgi:large subunit ribosomal protein L6